MTGRKIVVLDDDPTGIQTVNDIFVFTQWDKATITEGLLGDEPIFYILTNSRALTKQETINLHREIGHHLAQASKECGVDFLLISRGDSTLRGHYPIETETLKETIEAYGDIQYNGEIICPCFMEGGRITKEGVHYLKENDRLIPVGETEFSKDRTFAFTNSDLSMYVEEKTQGAFTAESCLKITQDLLTKSHRNAVEEILLNVTKFNKIIVDGTSYEELTVFKHALEKVLKKGRQFILRTAASLPKVLGEVSDRPLLVREDLVTNSEALGGLIIVGSHVDKTNRQLKCLKESETDLVYIEFDAEAAVHEDTLTKEYKRVRICVEEAIFQGRTTVVYTSRTLLSHTQNEEEKLKMSVKLSEGVSKVVNTLTIRPKFIIGKGGITSSDIGTKGLEVKKAKVLGQVRPGIPVWLTDEYSKFPQMPYIIFPGNVGNDETLLDIVTMLI